MTNEEAIAYIQEWLKDEYALNSGDRKALNAAIKALEQEPFMNKPCVAHQVCHEDKVKVLDKIKAEIEALPKTYPFVNHIDMYVKENDVKKIIDKYRIESENKK